MEKLFPITKDDNEFEVALEVMKQLVYLHQFGIHNDIKPGNIMKRIVNGKPKYLLIDYGGVATQRLSYGFKRWIWSPKWTSQELHGKNQVTTAKNDFIELVYTMKTIQNMRNGEDKRHRRNKDGEEEDNIRTGFVGRLAKLHDRVEQVNPKDIKEEDYLDIIRILEKACSE